MIKRVSHLGMVLSSIKVMMMLMIMVTAMTGMTTTMMMNGVVGCTVLLNVSKRLSINYIPKKMKTIDDHTMI